MQPMDPLLEEHRLIRRMLALVQQEFTRIRENVAVDPEFAFVDGIFIDLAVDFLKTYADRGHHGKEEEILFAALAGKDLTPEHRRALKELGAEHARLRETTACLLRAKENYLREQPKALDELLQSLSELTDFYPRHLKKEETQFFPAVLDYFTAPERDGLLAKMWEFDRKLIHEKYAAVVEGIENRRACRL